LDTSEENNLVMDIIIKHIKELIDALFTENKATPYKTSYGSEI